MKIFISLLVYMSTVITTHALVINEILSNPVGDDSGREWIEVYNNTDLPIDIALLTISIKGGSFVSVIPVSSETMVNPGGYAIIGSTVSGMTKFMQDYPGYSGPLVRSSISLVNTGVTSVEIKLQGVVADALPSYVAAKEGNSLSLLLGSFSGGVPSPGEGNRAQETQEEVVTTQTGSQATIPQMSSPSADIVLYLPKEKIVVAGAPSLFSVYSLTHEGKAISNVLYEWAYGDGGYGTGGTSTYRYFYPGRYVVQVEGSNGVVAGVARMVVRVVSPELSISPLGKSKYGNYIDITNPNNYDLDFSLWKLSIDGALFSFPKNTLLAPGVTRFSGVSMGFASTTVSSSTLVKLLFSNMDEVLRITQGEEKGLLSAAVALSTTTSQVKAIQKQRISQQKKDPSSVLKVSNISTTTSENYVPKKDTRLATLIKSFFGK